LFFVRSRKKKGKKKKKWGAPPQPRDKRGCGGGGLGGNTFWGFAVPNGARVGLGNKNGFGGLNEKQKKKNKKAPVNWVGFVFGTPPR